MNQPPYILSPKCPITEGERETLDALQAEVLKQAKLQENPGDAIRHYREYLEVLSVRKRFSS